MNLLNSATLKALAAGLDTAAARHAVIANNIANQNTPGYKAEDIDFSETMRQVLRESNAPALQARSTRLGHMQFAGASPMPASAAADDAGTAGEGATRTMRTDGNSVDVDLEMAKMAENSLLYDAMAQLAQSNFSILKHVISEGRR